MKKVNIRYLMPGLITLDMPDEIENLSKEEQREWAFEVLEKTSNRELLVGMETVDKSSSIADRIFDEAPWPEAIEETENNFKLILQTELWKTFMNGDKLSEDEE